jgi:hypothetical protein
VFFITYRLEMWRGWPCHVCGDLEPLELNRGPLESCHPSEISASWIIKFQSLLCQEIRCCFETVLRI